LDRGGGYDRVPLWASANDTSPNALDMTATRAIAFTEGIGILLNVNRLIAAAWSSGIGRDIADHVRIVPSMLLPFCIPLHRVPSDFLRRY
jgi:hypothetical protein